jgi:uncharacterized membrane protein YeiH
MNERSDSLLLAVDLAGTFVFAIEGALAAIEGDLDFFGVMVLSFTTALAGGGNSRSSDWRNSTRCIARLALFNSRVQRRRGGIHFSSFCSGNTAPLLITLDAAALILFAIAGTQKALEHRMHPFGRRCGLL